MNKPQVLLDNILDLFTTNQILIFILLFMIVSYLLIALFTWSIRKPLKYLSIPLTIVSILLLAIRFTGSMIISFLPLEINIPNTIISVILNPFLKSGIYCLLIAILFIIIYILTGKFNKNGKNETVENKQEDNQINNNEEEKIEEKEEKIEEKEERSK